MNDTCGPMSGMPLASYDPNEQCWKTSEATSLWALTLSSLTLPPWGCLRGGELFELPTPERPTIEQGFSSLPTPVADNSRGLPNGGNYQSLPNTVLTLPTPTAQAAKHMTMDDRGEGTHDDHNLWSVAGRLLPTPAVNDMGAGKDPQAWDEWAARQKAADGRPAPHGKSLEQEALKMLPTPTAHPENTASAEWAYPTLLDAIGATTHQPLTAGGTSSDAQHQDPLFNETDEIA